MPARKKSPPARSVKSAAVKRDTVPARAARSEPLVSHADVHPGSLIAVTSLSVDDVQRILKLADELESEAPARRVQRLFKRRVALLFYESSTRTRTSFELAAKALGADTTLVSDKSSSIEKGESHKNTGITLRAPYSGALYLSAKATGLPVLNAGDGMHAHPSQALLDLRTILACLKKSCSITPNTLRASPSPSAETSSTAASPAPTLFCCPGWEPA